MKDASLGLDQYIVIANMAVVTRAAALTRKFYCSLHRMDTRS